LIAAGARPNLISGMTMMGLFAAVRREYLYIRHAGKTLWMMRLVKPDSTRTIVDVVERRVAARPHDPALIYLDQVLSYGEMDARANRYANWALAQGIKRGDRVALLMENRPDYICAWLGLFKVGAQVALINTNLTGAALFHSVAIAGAGHAIVGAELAANFAAAGFQNPPEFWVEGAADPLPPGARDLSAALDIAHMCHAHGHAVESVIRHGAYTEFRLRSGQP
jgi:fatty-acyl-CoA synthase